MKFFVLVQRHLKRLLYVVCLFILFLVFSCLYWNLSPLSLAGNAARFLCSPVLGIIYDQDLDFSAELQKKNKICCPDNEETSSGESWRELETELPGINFDSLRERSRCTKDIPFVYEEMNRPYLSRLRTDNSLQQLVRQAESEYDAMLKLAAWVGTRWDHGIEGLPVEGRYEPNAILATAEQGKKYWCEIAAIVTVQAATSLGWPARLVTASRDGYRWEHALAELWSNEFNKWFVVDADFNIVYESDGVPLSAFELCHKGEKLQADNKLKVRQIAPMKASMKMIDLIPYYRYVHIDLRNDWYSRRLRKGSPAGGDLSTWWTARPSLQRVLTAKKYVDSQEKFDWKVNTVSIRALGLAEPEGEHGAVLQVALSGYVPYFKRFQVKRDDGRWDDVEGCQLEWKVEPGHHCLQVRAVTNAAIAEPGPVSKVCYTYR